MGSYFVGRVFASTGIWIHNVVAAVIVYDITGSALLVGMVSVCQFLPQLLLAPFAGVRADRGSRRGQAVTGGLVSGLAAAIVAGWLAITGVEGIHPAVILAGAVFVGIGMAIGQPATQALVPSLAGPRELGAVVAIDAAPMTIARAAGPAIGLTLLAIAGPAVPFGAVAATQLLHAAIIWRLRLRTETRTESADTSFRGGLRHLRVDPTVGLLLLGVVGIGMGVDPAITLTPALAADFDGGTRLVALLTSAFGMGAVTGPVIIGLLRSRLSEPVVGTSGLLMLTAGMAAVAVSPSPTVAVICLFIAGIGMMVGLTGFTTELQKRLPGEMRGRIMSLWAICFIGTRPLAATINGAIADVLSVRAALLSLAVLLALITFLSRPARLRQVG